LTTAEQVREAATIFFANTGDDMAIYIYIERERERERVRERDSENVFCSTFDCDPIDQTAKGCGYIHMLDAC
jgi:hypothetical protein